MIIRLTAHKTSQDVVVVHAGPELAEFMGRFGFARWQPAAKAYWVEVAHLDTFRRDADRQGHTLVDDRAKGAEPERFVGPLPECSACGQPASRKAAEALERCPGCGAAWRPVVHDPEVGGLAAPRVECEICGRRQKAGFAYCGGCGAPAKTAPGGAPRPVIPDAGRERLEHPVTVGQVIDEAQLDLDQADDGPPDDDDERDFMERAAGDRS